MVKLKLDEQSTDRVMIIQERKTMTIKCGIVGATGYTGSELLRLLCFHPQAHVAVATSRAEDGRRVDDYFPFLRGHVGGLTFSNFNVSALSDCDVVFFATPHGTAMTMAPELLETGTRVIDLGADYRIKDVDNWSTWYNLEHTSSDWVAKAVYGLPERYRDDIKSAQLVANPGCYPTAVTLGFLPLLDTLNEDQILIADAKSGISGAGRKANVNMLLAEATENFKAYGVSGHRHLPEILQNLSSAAGKAIKLNFTPHLLPMVRGIHATLYAHSHLSLEDTQQRFEDYYKEEAFVDVMPLQAHPETKAVKGTNMCRIAIHQPQDQGLTVVLSVIDNLVKGAAGQAIQNMNIMFSLEETTGLNMPALVP